jgi:hypothetical protein
MRWEEFVLRCGNRTKHSAARTLSRMLRCSRSQLMNCDSSAWSDSVGRLYWDREGGFPCKESSQGTNMKGSEESSALYLPASAASHSPSAE